MKLYQVILENHDNLSADYVTAILVNAFHKEIKEAELMSIQLKQNGFSVLDTLPFQFAEQKVAELIYLAQFDSVHLQCYFEELEA